MTDKTIGPVFITFGIDHKWNMDQLRIMKKRVARRKKYANRIQNALALAIKGARYLDVIFESRISEKSLHDEDSLITITLISYRLAPENRILARIRILLRSESGRSFGLYHGHTLPPIRNNNRVDGLYYRDEAAHIDQLIADAKLVIDRNLVSPRK